MCSEEQFQAYSFLLRENLFGAYRDCIRVRVCDGVVLLFREKKVQWKHLEHENQAKMAK